MRIARALRHRSAHVRTGVDRVGEPTELQYPVVKFTAPLLPPGKARYLMGVGHPKDILHAVASGIDMFDCVLPTRMARHHALYTMQGCVNILNQRWSEHDGPVDAQSVFPQTNRYSAAYLRHLMRAAEPLGARLCTLHNLAFYARMMQEIREAIEAGAWPALIERYANAQRCVATAGSSQRGHSRLSFHRQRPASRNAQSPVQSHISGCAGCAHIREQGESDEFI